MSSASKSISPIVLSTVLLFGFTTNALALPEGVTCTGTHQKGNGTCYDGCSKNGSAITGNYGVDGLWHDGLCATIVKKQSGLNAKAIIDQAKPGQDVAAPAK